MVAGKLSRYIFFTLLSAIAFIAIALTFVVWLTQILRFLELVVDAGAPASVFFEMLILTMPRFLEVVLPFACVGGILFIFNKFIMDNELIVMRAAGLSPWQITKGAIVLSLLLSIFLFILSGWLAPMAHAEVQRLKQYIRTEYSALLLREGVFNSLDDKTTVYVRERQESGHLKGILIHQGADEKQPQAITIIAREGYLVNKAEEGTTQIIVNDGSQQQKDPQTGYVSRLDFDNYTIDVTPSRKQGQERWVKPDERVFTNLLFADMSLRENQPFIGQLSVEANRRIASSFLLFSFCMIALASLLSGEFDRRGQNWRIATAIMLIVITQSLFMAMNSAAIKNPNLIAGLYIIALLPALLSWAVLKRWIIIPAIPIPKIGLKTILKKKKGQTS